MKDEQTPDAAKAKERKVSMGCFSIWVRRRAYRALKGRLHALKHTSEAPNSRENHGKAGLPQGCFSAHEAAMTTLIHAVSNCIELDMTVNIICASKL